jgi:hypothetical protein
MFPTFGTPDWVFKTIILVIAVGFPFAVIFAWAFELTPEGVKKTRDVNVAVSVTTATGRKLDFIIIAALVIALGYFIWERQVPTDSPAHRPDSVAEHVAAIEAIESGETVEEEAPKRSIAVIPFVNMSSDKEQEWFADGLTEEILNSLSHTGLVGRCENIIVYVQRIERRHSNHCQSVGRRTHPRGLGPTQRRSLAGNCATRQGQ